MSVTSEHRPEVVVAVVVFDGCCRLADLGRRPQTGQAVMERVDIALESGGTVTLTVEGDFLWMTPAEFGFVAGLAEMMHSYAAAWLNSPVADVALATVTAGLGDGNAPEEEPAVPAPAKPKVRRNGAPVDYHKVAEVYVKAVAEGRKPIQAICDHFDAEHTTAKNWPAKCRELGLLPPLGEPVVHTEAPHQFVQHGREPLR